MQIDTIEIQTNIKISTPDILKKQLKKTSYTIGLNVISYKDGKNTEIIQPSFPLNSWGKSKLTE